MSAAGAEQGFVPVGQGAGGGMSGEVRFEPLALAGGSFASAHVIAFAVQHDDVPGTQVVAVETVSGWAGRGAEILEIKEVTDGVEFVIAGSGPSARLGAAPGSVVAGEIFLRAVGIRQVAYSHDGARDLIEEFGGGLGAGEVAAVGDVTCTNERGGGRGISCISDLRRSDGCKGKRHEGREKE